MTPFLSPDVEQKGNVSMVTISNEIIEKIQRFLHGISASGLHVERAMLFGSYTKGTANTWSDIDVAIVSKDFTGVGFYDRKRVNPFLIKVDSRIEPHPFRPEDFTEDNPFVNEILKDALNVIRLFSYNHRELDLGTEMSFLKTRLDDVKSATQIEQLFGLEGSAARTYFDAFSKMLLDKLGFPGRKKHPSTDPVNALLSLSYTMIFNEISSLLDGLGFDPYLAYYHSIDYGRASLASDLMEEFRAPIADRLILNLVNNRIFKQNDFYTIPPEGVHLKRESLKRFFVEYEGALNNEFIHPATKEKTTYRKCFRLQAENLAVTLQNDIPYIPFELEI